MENINRFWIQETEIQDQDWRIEMEEYSYSSMPKQGALYRVTKETIEF